MLHFLRLCLTLAAILVMLPVVLAAEGENNTDKEAATAAGSSKFPVWIASFGCELSTTVRLSTITSVSLHTYMLDGSMKVSELTVDTQGNNSLRIYCISAEKANDLKGRFSNVRNLLDKKTENASHLPSRKFPEGTYSHNVEYQVDNTRILKKAHESLMKAWLNNKSVSFSASSGAQ